MSTEEDKRRRSRSRSTDKFKDKSSSSKVHDDSNQNSNKSFDDKEEETDRKRGYSQDDLKKAKLDRKRHSELKEKREDKEKRRESNKHYTRTTDKNVNKTEPKIIGAKSSLNDTYARTMIHLTNTAVLPDKNLQRLKHIKQNSFSLSKSSIEEPTNTATTSKNDVPFKTKIDGTIKEKTEKLKIRSHKGRDKVGHNDKRGMTSIYAPQDAASKLRETMKAAKSKRSKDAQSRNTSRDRRRSRTLSPSEVKILNSKFFKKSHPSVENDPEQVDSEDEFDYNQLDDFEDYESEVEDYTVATQANDQSDASLPSIDLEPIILKSKEKKRYIASASIRQMNEDIPQNPGHYELAEVKKRAAVVDSLLTTQMKTPPSTPKIQQSSRYETTENNSLPPYDEGFEDLRSGDFVKSLTKTQINVIEVAEKLHTAKIHEEPRPLTRGQILMSMIKLDAVEFSLYEAKPISYDDYIRMYGRLNTRQVYTQTNEDNLNVDIQTDLIELENKWTQFPVKCKGTIKTIDDVRQFKMDNFGVGGDIPDNFFSIPSFDALNLSEFLNKASKVVLALLEEKECGGNVLKNETHGFPFSDGCIQLSVNSISFLSGRQIKMLLYSDISNKIILSIHGSAYEKTESSKKQDYIRGCCIGCIWNINEPSRPIKIIYSQNEITTCCFHYTNNNIIFAGLQDGSICLWDLREDETCHQKIVDKLNEMDWIIRSPTYSTAGIWEIESHTSSIVSIRALSNLDQDEAENLNDKFVTIQICSLDEDGRLIIWSVLRNLKSNPEDLGLSQWGRVKLVKSQEVPLFTKKFELNGVKKQFVDMNVDNVDSNNLYLAVNDTSILYANCAGGRNSTPFYKINEMDSCGTITCIEVCPFKQSYFVAGCKDGSIRLHSLHLETPLLKLKSENNPAGIKNIQWSKLKPLTIFVLDDYSRIVLWDLGKSDICSVFSSSTKSWGIVNCIRLSSCKSNQSNQNLYLALGTDDGRIEIHKLNKKYFFSDQSEVQQEVENFLTYVSVL